MTPLPPSDIPETGLLQRFWRSIFPTPLGNQDQAGRNRFYRGHLIFHFRPATVKAKTLDFTLTWGLGGMAATLILLQIATGMLLTFVYVPTPVDAYASVRLITTQIPFGGLVRNIHHWSANFLVMILLLHLFRVFFTGAFHPPRQFNWVIGLFLFGLVLVANLSGYLLPYDQLAYWAVTVITAMIGYLPVIGPHLQNTLGIGTDLGPKTLPFFFSMHTAVIPSLLIFLMAFHFWRIRKAGGVVTPRKPDEKIEKKPLKIASIPHLLVKEISTALSLTAIVMIVSASIDAPLSTPANPGLSPEVVRAPWYFAGFQELLLHFHPALAVTAVPILVGIFFLGIPYFEYSESTEGIWFATGRGKMQTVIIALATLIVVPILVVLDTTVLKTAAWGRSMPPYVRDGIIPVLLLLLMATITILTLKKRMNFTTAEIVQSLFVIQMTGLIVLTIVSVFFRGPSMQLIWPF
jgi:quinol-cytochrome oxidoreductase complex cytochrome b subunit